MRFSTVLPSGTPPGWPGQALCLDLHAALRQLMTYKIGIKFYGKCFVFKRKHCFFGGEEDVL